MIYVTYVVPLLYKDLRIAVCRFCKNLLDKHAV